MTSFLSGLFNSSGTLSLQELRMAPTCIGEAPMNVADLRNLLDLVPADIEFAELPHNATDEELERLLANML